MQANYQRFAQNDGKREPRPWPAHPYASGHAPSTASERPDDRLDSRNTLYQSNGEFDEPPDLGDEEAEIIQVAAQELNVAQLALAQPATGSATITGRVVDSNGNPQSFVSIVASPTRRLGGKRVETITDQRGSFTLRGLESGQRYLILATATRSPVALIGRAAVIPPQQGITIGISRPHTASRPTDTVTGGQEAASRLRPLPMEKSAGSGLHPRDPFSRPPPAPTTAYAPPVPPTSKQTREQVADSNRLNSPWDMPAPPKNRSHRPTNGIPPSDRRSDGTATSQANGWRQAGTRAGTAMHKAQPSSPPRGVSLLDGPPSNSHTSRESRASIEPDEVDVRTPPTPPRRVTRPPIEVDADAKPDRPRDTVAKTNGAVGLPAEANGSRSAPRAELHPSPMCQMDGKQLVDFQLDDVDGRPVSFATTNSQLVLIDFWATWCRPCVKAIPRLANLQKRYGSQGLQVLGIACESGDLAGRRARVARIRSQLHVPYPLLIDEGDDNLLVRDNFGVVSYPTLVLLDKSGKVIWRSETAEAADLNQLENLLKNHLNSTASRDN
jgi:thiol-disulfide isomerase/thioredoxin